MSALRWFGITLVAAVIGAVGSSNAPSFYGELAMPAWAPPAWVFAPVWTLLYALMATAAWLVERARGHAARSALTLYVVQLVANALWSWLFFTWRRGDLAFVDIVVLWFLIAATTVAFWRVRTAAGVLLLPYLAWVGFAGALNLVVWRMNLDALG
jgi:tryptophan-rich sensory protein